MKSYFKAFIGVEVMDYISKIRTAHLVSEYHVYFSRSWPTVIYLLKLKRFILYMWVTSLLYWDKLKSINSVFFRV